MSEVAGRIRVSSRVRVLIAVVLLAGLTLVASAAPARAGHACSVATNGVATLNLDDTGDRVVLKMKNNKLYVDGVVCGEPGSIFIQDAGALTSDDVVIDLTNPFRSNGDWVTVSQNLKSHVMADKITIRGAKTKDIVDLSYQFLTVKAPTNYAANDAFRLRMSLPASGARIVFELRGGNDRFDMAQPPNQTYDALVTVLGGAGNDTIKGSLGRQIFKGGSGQDVIAGREGRDKLYGDGGNDEIAGGKGGDYIRGGGGNDDASGASGADHFRMDDGNPDTIDGGAGKNDSCICDPGDTITGLP